jgi:hypothetical protein
MPGVAPLSNDCAVQIHAARGNAVASLHSRIVPRQAPPFYDETSRVYRSNNAATLMVEGIR